MCTHAASRGGRLPLLVCSTHSANNLKAITLQKLDALGGIPELYLRVTLKDQSFSALLRIRFGYIGDRTADA